MVIKLKHIKNKIMIVMVSIVILVTFSTRYLSLVKGFESEVQSKVVKVERYIELCSTFISMMTIYGDDFFLQDTSVDSKFFDMLQYNEENNTYNLDILMEKNYRKSMGNITGIGTIPMSGKKRDEINLAFQFNQFFDSIYQRIPDAAWLYYTSENDFVSMYPWIASEDFKYSKELKTAVFYTSVIPKNNPSREYRWTPVYLDHAGKGLMVSLSGPIYNKDIFMGVVSLDLSNEQLSEILDSKFEGYLIDSTESVIAASNNLTFHEDLIKMKTLLKNPTATLKEINVTKHNSVQRVGTDYVYAVEFEHTPWRLVYRIPIAEVILNALVYTLPVFLIGIFFLFSINEVRARKKTEDLLKDSVTELQSYQNILENAAKLDFLTSCYNRRGFKERFQEKLEMQGEKKIPIAFILGDIDCFKKLNDTYGHNAGDQVLVEVSACMKKNISDMDILCRWGGEEFLIVLFERDFEKVLHIAENIRKEIEAIEINWEDSCNIKTTITFGVAEYNDDDSIETIVSKADTALYFGKANGRNRVISYYEVPK